MPTTQVRIAGQTIDVVDLTLPISPDTEVFPGDPTIDRSVFSTCAETGFEHYVHAIGDHACVPHADAPKHQNPDRQHQGVEIFGLADEFHRARLIDLTGADEVVTIDGIAMLQAVDRHHLEDHDLSGVSAVVVRTGAEAWRLSGRPFRPECISYFTPAAGEYLRDQGQLRVVAIDSLTVDHVVPGAPVHTVHQLLVDKIIVESVVHLDELTRDTFLLQVALLRIVGATGCPVIARAYLCD